jgi:hypothetical protein
VSNPLTVTVPTTLDQSTWGQLLEDETDADGNVEDATVDTDADTLTVTLKPGVYELRLAKVGVGTNVDETSETYITTVDAPESTGTEARQEFTVEVRDEYNNPVSGVVVEAGANRGMVRPSSRTTDEEGRVTFTYEAPSSAGDDTIRVSYSGFGSGFSYDDPDDVAYSVSVNSGSSSSDSNTNNNINPTDKESGAVQLIGSSPDGNKTVDLKFENTGSEDRTWAEARIAFFYKGKNNKIPSFGRLEGNSNDELRIGDDFESINSNIVVQSSADSSSTPKTVNIDFGPGGVTGEIKSSFFILQVEYQETGEIATYFIAPGDGGGNPGGGNPGGGNPGGGNPGGGNN